MGKEVLLNIGVIGMGNCGGQMAQAAAEKGFGAVAINASLKDLDLLNDKVTKFGVGDGNGTGKSRAQADAFIREKINVFADETMVKFFDEHDVIVIATSTAGGFGSGSSLTVQEIVTDMYPDKAVIVAGVLPFNAEMETPHEHAIEWLQELEMLEATYMIYDNNRFAKMGTERACATVNEQFANDLCVLRGDFVNSTKTGGIDNRDMMTVVSCAGRLVVDTMKLDVSDIVDDSIPTTILNHIKASSAHADLTTDKVLLASATMYTLRGNFTPYTIDIKKQMSEVFGVSVSDYDNFAMVDDSFEEDDSVAVILSGLSEPVLRINRLVARLTEIQEAQENRSKAVSKLGSIDTSKKKSVLKAKTLVSSDAAPTRKGPDRAAILSKYATASKKPTE